MEILVVAIGGSLGAVIRYLATTGLYKFYPNFPSGTLLVNLVGSFLIGLSIPFLNHFSSSTRLFFAIGFLGSLTTLSTFASDFFLLTEERRMIAAILFWFLNSVFSLVLCFLGMLLGRFLIKV